MIDVTISCYHDDMSELICFLDDYANALQIVIIAVEISPNNKISIDNMTGN